MGGKEDFHWNFVLTVHVCFWRFSPASLTESYGMVWFERSLPPEQVN